MKFMPPEGEINVLRILEWFTIMIRIIENDDLCLIGLEFFISKGNKMVLKVNNGSNCTH